MIARWFFEENPSSGAVQIHLYWDTQRRRAATLAPPARLADLLDEIDRVGMDVPSALAAAVLVSARSEVDLRITGDKSVWQASWGTLEELV